MAKIIRIANSRDFSDEMPAMMPSRPAPVPPLSRAFFETSPPTQPNPPSSSHTDEITSLAPSSSGRRRGSLPGFLQRAASHEIPTTQSFSNETGRAKTMLRKHKVRDQEEYLRQQRLLSQLPKQAPQLPSPLPMPVIEGFGGSDRPDSVAMFSGRLHEQQYLQEQHQQQLHHRPAVNNFSRPGFVARSASNNSLNPATRHHLHSDVSARVFDTANKNAEHENDPYARAGSMTNRGRESYASLSVGPHVNSPRRVRRRKDPTPFNILIIGAKKSGKTSFIEFLKTSLALPARKGSKSHSPLRENVLPDSAFTPTYLETELDGERVGLTLWDSKGLEKNIVDLQLREMSSFIESKFEDTFTEEQKVVRSPGVQDTHIHCVLLILDPSRLDAEAAAAVSSKKQTTTIQTLDEELDLQVMRALSGKTTVIPIISKADTLTAAHMASLKRNVWSNIQEAKLDPLEALGLEDEESEEEEEEEESEELSSSEDVSSSELNVVPKSFPPTEITGSTMHTYDDTDSVIDDLVDRGSSSPNRTTPGTTPSPVCAIKSTKGDTFVENAAATRNLSPTTASAALIPSMTTDEIYIPFSILSPDPLTLPHTLTRVFPWGEADPLNPSHCDFTRLRDCVFGDWRAELRVASREKWYEGWRTSRLKRTPQGIGRMGTGRVRQTGGVTPAAVVPREGRRASGSQYDHGQVQMDGRVRLGPGSGKAEKVLGSPRGVAI